MAQVLYRKYRSKNLNEIVGQEHITKTLSEAIKNGRISHAYLFTGPRGVGKTSIARILAREVNGLSYEGDQPHIDIIEIDAASNRRIDEIRDLRDKVHISPASAKYKVYIIDEVHMLTKEAFNALLKTLEEPPEHVIFILATTDAHKLPETIISRTQRFSFKPIESSAAAKHLGSIAKKENIKISDKALELIAEQGEGSLRDSTSMLDQLSSSSKDISEDDVRAMLGVPPTEAIDKLISLLETNSSYKEVSEVLKGLYDQGYSASILSKRLMNDLRDRLIDNKLEMDSTKAISLLKELLEVDKASDQNSYLLLVLLNNLTNEEPLPAQEVIQKEEPKKVSEAPVEASPVVATKIEDIAPRTKKVVTDVDESIWPEVLNELKNKYNTLYGIVRMAQPVFKDNGQLDLIFDFAFHKKQVSEPKNTQIVSTVISDITGQSYHITSYLSDKPHTEPEPEKISKPSNKDLDNINLIFGGGEVVD